ncbi:MAG: zinc-ribbon domain-containing protein, partial [Acidimicrobiales bacterium]
MSCPSCGAVAIDGARFCSTCGQPLVTRSDERRVATVVFADLVGFTSLSESADPEQIKNLVDTCFELLVRDVTSFGGKVDKIV